MRRPLIVSWRILCVGYGLSFTLHNTVASPGWRALCRPAGALLGTAQAGFLPPPSAPGAHDVGPCASQLQAYAAAEEARALQALLQRAQLGLRSRPSRQSSRAHAVVLHLDQTARLGDVLLLQFRVQNQQASPILLTSLEIWDMAAPGQGVRLALPPRLQAAASARASVQLSTTALGAGASATGGVAWVAGLQAQRLGLRLWLRDPQPQRLTLADIVLP